MVGFFGVEMVLIPPRGDLTLKGGRIMQCVYRV